MTKARLSDWDVPETRSTPIVSRGSVATFTRYGAALAAVAGGMLGIFAGVGNLSGHLPLMLARWETAGFSPLLVMAGWLAIHALAIVAGLALLRFVGIGRAIAVIVLVVLMVALIAGLSQVNSIDAAVPALIFAAYLLSRLAGVLNPRSSAEPIVLTAVPARIEPGMVAATPSDRDAIAMPPPAWSPPVQRTPKPRPSDRRPFALRRSTAVLIVALVAFDSIVITLIASSLIWPGNAPQTAALGLSEPLDMLPPAAEPTRVAETLPTSPAAALEPAGYADPFAYCTALGSIDAVDARYVGPNPPPVLSQRLGEAANSADVEIVWRCADGAVQACAQRYWPVCNRTPEMEDMVTFCRAITQTGVLAAPGGPWTCEDGRPVLPAEARWPVDARGFLPQAWTEVARASAS